MQEKTENLGRRSALGGLGAGALGLFWLALYAGKSTVAKGAVGEENVLLAQIAGTASSIYDTAMKYQKAFNSYVERFNKFMETADLTKTFVDRIRNIGDVFHETKQDMENILKGFVGKTGGDITKLRLNKLHLQSIAIAKFYRLMARTLDSIQGNIEREAKSNNLEETPRKLQTLKLRKEVELKNMRAEAAIAATSQRRDAFRSLLSLAKNDKAKAQAEQAASVVTTEELLKRLLEQQMLTNRLIMTQIEIATHGKPLIDASDLSSKDFEQAWGRIEKDSDYD